MWKIATPRGERFPLTSVHYLMTQDQFSGFHLLKLSTEIIYHHQGTKVRYHCIDEKGNYEEKILSDTKPAVVFPPNTWFAGEIISEKENDFALVSACCSPGFDFEDFVLGNKKDLLSKFPH